MRAEREALPSGPARARNSLRSTSTPSPHLQSSAMPLEKSWSRPSASPPSYAKSAWSSRLAFISASKQSRVSELACRLATMLESKDQ